MTDELQSLELDLAAMREDQSATHNPARFRYIESLVLRADGKGAAVTAILADKANQALLDYQQALEQIPGKQPLSEEQQSPHDVKTLAALTAQLNEQASLHGDNPDGSALDDLLRAQESEAVNTVREGVSSAGRSTAHNNEELKSARRFRATQVKQNADKLVTQAVAEIPEDSGPLNSQRLAARSLAAMRDLSPHYLSRFVTYMDTLFWLEQADKEKR
ncbi:MAG: DUF2894 domain-containing protein [Halieaceae bacterium]